MFFFSVCFFNKRNLTKKKKWESKSQYKLNIYISNFPPLSWITFDPAHPELLLPVEVFGLATGRAAGGGVDSVAVVCDS